MKSTRLLAFAALSTLALNSGCITNCASKESVCPDGPVAQVEVPGLADYSDYCFAGRIADAEQAKQYVITSATQYDALFSCVPRPAIDFAAYTLLAGKTRMTSGGAVDSQQVSYPCQGSDYTFTVKLRPGLTQATAEVAYFAVVPKLPAGAKVTFDVQQP